MNIGGRTFGEHLRLLWPLFAMITAVWLIRLVSSAIHLSPLIVSAASLTLAAPLAVLIAVVMMHRRGFGGYANVVVASFLILAYAHFLIVLAIIFSVATGVENVFTRPEFSIPRDDAFHIRHILGHLTFGIGAGTILGAGTGCLLLWLLRTLVPRRQTA